MHLGHTCADRRPQNPSDEVYIVFTRDLCVDDVGELTMCLLFFFFQAEDGIRDLTVTGVQTCALPISNQLRGSGAPTGDRAQAPTAPPAPASEAPAPKLQSLAPSPQRVIADAIIVPPQISDVPALASSATRQEILATDFSSKVTAATSFVSAAPALVATPIFTSAYSSSVLAWDTIQSNVAAIAPAVTDLVTNPAVASTVAAVVAPAAKIFNFA